MRTVQEIRAKIADLYLDSRGISSQWQLQDWQDALEWVLNPTKRPPVWEDMGGLVEDCAPSPRVWKLHPTKAMTQEYMMDPEEEEWRAWEKKQSRRRVTFEQLAADPLRTIKLRRYTIFNLPTVPLRPSIDDVYWGARGV